MPQILSESDMPVHSPSPEWQETTLADDSTIPMTARRLTLTAGASSPTWTHNAGDQLLYVISGNGVVRINEENHQIDHESVIWLDFGDEYQFVAAENGLEILQGFVPRKE